MRKIHINNVRKGEKSSPFKRRQLHSIYLGNGLTCYFPSARKALAFQASTNRFLNDLALELNDIYAQVWHEHRRLLPSFFHLLGNQPAAAEHIRTFENAFFLALSRSDMLNGSHFTFKRFYTMIEALGGFCGCVVSLLKSRRLHYSTFQLEIFARRLDQVKAGLDNWGKEYAENTNGRR